MLPDESIPLRHYRSADLDAIFQLDEICFSTEFRFDRRSMQSFAGRKGAIALVAEGEGDAIAAFVIVHLERSSAGLRGYVVTLDVAIAYRRRGLAEKLMLEAERCAAAAGALSMDLHVFVGNEQAIRFYQRLGYAQVGETPGFYGRVGLDAFAYRKPLTNV